MSEKNTKNPKNQRQAGKKTDATGAKSRQNTAPRTGKTGNPPQKSTSAPEKKVQIEGLMSKIRAYNFKLRKQRYKYGTLATIFTAIVITVVILLNVLTGLVTDKYGIKFDMTKEKRFEISDGTKEVLDRVKDNIYVNVFMTEAKFRAQKFGNEMAETMDKYRVYTGGLVDINYIDPLRNPTFANKYKGDLTISEGDIVIEMGEEFRAVKNADIFYWYDNSRQNAVGTTIERRISSNILNIMTENPVKVGLLYGHQELHLGRLQVLLQETNFEVVMLNLNTDDIPDDVTLLIMSCPGIDYAENEILKLERYLAKFNNLIFMHGGEVERLVNLELLFKEWGIEFENSLVLDAKYRVLGDYKAIVTVPSSGAVEAYVEGLGTSQYVIMPFSREMRVLWAEKGLTTVVPLLGTSNEAYSKAIKTGTGEQIDSYEQEEGDKRGPFATAVLSTYSSIVNNEHVESNILFLSSPYIFLEEFLNTESYGNLRFTVNVFAQFNKENLTASIPSRKFTDPELKIIGNSLSITLFLLTLVPVLILISGLVMWRRRKNR